MWLVCEKYHGAFFFIFGLCSHNLPNTLDLSVTMSKVKNLSHSSKCPYWTCAIITHQAEDHENSGEVPINTRFLGKKNIEGIYHWKGTLYISISPVMPCLNRTEHLSTYPRLILEILYILCLLSCLLWVAENGALTLAGETT